MQSATVVEADRLAVGFARVLRGVGISSPLDSVLTFVQALGVVGMNDKDSVYWAARSTLVRRPEDLPLFDKAFRVFGNNASLQNSFKKLHYLLLLQLMMIRQI